MTRIDSSVNPVLLEEVQRYIDDQVEENSTLEYKEADAIGRSDAKKKEIAKDVSAIANSSGGRIIYGIRECKEARHFPEAITPIKRGEYSKEWLEQIIIGNISPKIEGIIIHSVACAEENEVVYVVDVPMSSTAHQCTADHRYYKRYNFQSVPMLDYEIRDVMNRAKHPVIELLFYITTETYEVHDLMRSLSPYAGKKEPQYATEIKLHIVPTNIGDVYANYVAYFVDLPKDILHQSSIDELNEIAEETMQYQGDNTYRDVVDYKAMPFGGGIPKYGSSRFDPILPRLKGVSRKIRLTAVPETDDRDIVWRVHADNAEPRIGYQSLGGIPVSDISEDVRESEE